MNSVREVKTESLGRLEVWQLKKIRKELEDCSGTLTLLTLIISPGLGISFVRQDLINIRNNFITDPPPTPPSLLRLEAFAYMQKIIDLMTELPPKGLILFCGTITNEDGQEKKINVHFQPDIPFNRSGFSCDVKFRTGIMRPLLVPDINFGFIIVNKHGCLVGKHRRYNIAQVLLKLAVDLRRKNTQRRCARLSARYITRVAQIAASFFISNEIVTIGGLVLAGSSRFKIKLEQPNVFDPRLQAKIINTVEVTQGMELGYSQAVKASYEAMDNAILKVEKEKKKEKTSPPNLPLVFLCRGAVRQCLTRDRKSQISQLEIPSTLKDYLQDDYYLSPNFITSTFKP